MSWQQIEFVVDAERIDALSNVLEGFLAQAITTENAGEDEFYEVAFPGTPDWQKVKLTALFAEDIDSSAIIDFVRHHIAELDEVPIQVSKLVDQDWERVWLDSFKPIQVGTNLWVCPSWCEPIQPTARNIILDPGLAFGTGTHATTHLCLQWLSEQDLSGQRVLDYGSGSGLLAIAALFSGAHHADAVDIDPLAVVACNENSARNQVQDKLDAYLPSDLPHTKSHGYHLVIANILAEVIIELKDTLLLHLNADGTLLLTGILIEQAERVQSVYQDFDFTIHQQEHWCLLTGRLK